MHGAESGHNTRNTKTQGGCDWCPQRDQVVRRVLPVIDAGLSRKHGKSGNRGLPEIGLDLENRSVALFTPHPDFATNPTLLWLVDKLTSCGASVDVFMPGVGRYPKPNGVNRYLFPHGINLLSPSSKTKKKSIRHRFRKNLSHWKQLARLATALRRVRHGQYDVLFGVDSLGIITAARYARAFRVPLVYLSFEIFFRDEMDQITELAEKDAECEASRLADLVLVQDPWRKALLAEENKLAEKVFEYLPVSSAGTAAENSGYLRSRFGIPADKRIVLHSGSFANWTYGNELVELAARWPKDFVLVVHTRNSSDGNHLVDQLQELGRENVIVSTEPLPMDQYEVLVASADIGLVIYKWIPGCRYNQKNTQTIGLSSGKFSFYMKYGLPVVSVAQKTYGQLLHRFAFGENVASLHDIPAALARIDENYDFHRGEARRLFSERLDLEEYWPSLQQRLMELVQQRKQRA